MKPLEWRFVSEEESAEQDRLDKENIPPEVYEYACPYCGVGRGGWCMTKGGNWATHSHTKRLALLPMPGDY